MDPEYKFRLKTYFYYILVEPWTEKFSLPNFRTLVWVLILVAGFFRIQWLLIASIILGVLVYLAHEFRSGKHIYWYRQRKFKEIKAIKKSKETTDEPVHS